MQNTNLMQMTLATPEVQSVPSIASSAMFVELSISTWTGRKLDKRATKETTQANGADDRAAVRMRRVRHRLHTRGVGAHEVAGSR